jgi:putative transcriptional regulator
MAQTKEANKKRNIAQELRDDLENLKAAKRGEVQLRTRTFVQVAAPAEIRNRLNLSQYDFAGMLGVSVRTVQEWEQGRSQPSGPASALLRIADQEPEVFLRLK